MNENADFNSEQSLELLNSQYCQNEISPEKKKTPRNPIINSKFQKYPLSTPTAQQPFNQQRTNYLQWEDYFMSIAILSAKRSKDPNKQVGACIVNTENKIVSIGYNGMPIGCDDSDMPWCKNDPQNKLNSKYLYVCHAEMNAIMNKNSADVKNCRIYVTMFPCNECAKLIIQSGIKHVIYKTRTAGKKYLVPFQATQKMFEMAGVSFREFEAKQSEVVIDLGMSRVRTLH